MLTRDFIDELKREADDDTTVLESELFREALDAVFKQAVLALELHGDNKRLHETIDFYVHENAQLKTALSNIRDWAHDYGIDHDDKAMQELEAIIDGTADKEAH